MIRPMTRRARIAVAHTLMTASAAAITAAVPRADAQSYTWVGPTPGTWHVPTNWSTGTIPDGATADVFVDGGATTNVNVNVLSDVTVRSLNVSAADRVHFQGAGPVGLTATTVHVASGGTLSMWVDGPLRATSITTTGTGRVRGQRSRADLSDASVNGHLDFTSGVITLGGTVTNWYTTPGAQRIALRRLGSGGTLSDGRMVTQGPTLVTAPQGAEGEIFLDGAASLVAEDGPLTLRRQLVSGTGRLSGTFFNGDAGGPSRIFTTRGTLIVGSASTPTHIHQTTDSVIGADGVGGAIGLTDGASITGGRVVTVNGGILGNYGPGTLNDLVIDGTVAPGVQHPLQLNNVVLNGTLRLADAIVNANNFEFAHGTLDFVLNTSTLSLGRPIVMRERGLLRVQQASYTAPAGEDLGATEGGKVVALANGRLNNAPGRDIRADAGGLIYARDQGQILADGGSGGDLVAGPGGFVGAGAGAIVGGTGGGRLHADGGTIFGRGALFNPLITSGGALRPGDEVDYLASGPVNLPASVGSVFVGGDLSVDAASSVVVDVRRHSPQSIITDFVDVSGSVTLAGSLVVRQFDVDPLLPGESFSPLKYAARTGAFDAVVNATPYPGLSFDPTYTDTRLTITARARGGDANLDAVVNLTDFNILASRFGQSGQNWRSGDFTGDGLVNLDDFNILAGNFGQSAASAAGTAPTADDWASLASVVPEPASAGGAALSAALLRRRRRVKSAAAFC